MQRKCSANRIFRTHTHLYSRQNYLSALYTCYTMILSVINLVKFRKVESPILSAAKVLNFVASMMSLLGLQTAMIARKGGI